MGHFRDVPQANLLAWYGETKPNNKTTHSTIISYDIPPGNGVGLFWFRRLINLSLTYLHLLTAAGPTQSHTYHVVEHIKLRGMLKKLL